MKKIPITLTPEQGRAALDGNLKFVAVPIRPQPFDGNAMYSGFRLQGIHLFHPNYSDPHENTMALIADDGLRECPYHPGHVLWCRETWAHDAHTLEEFRQRFKDGLSGGLPYGPYFRADPVHENTGLYRRSPATMPKWACRLWLKVVSVKVMSVQDVTTIQAINAGVIVERAAHYQPIFMFHGFWNNHHRKYPFESNPWVWALDVEKCVKPEGW